MIQILNSTHLIRFDCIMISLDLIALNWTLSDSMDSFGFNLIPSIRFHWDLGDWALGIQVNWIKMYIN